MAKTLFAVLLCYGPRSPISYMDNNQNDERKRTPVRRAPFTELNQVSSDFAMAVALQQEERAFTMLSTIDSETDEEDEEIEESSGVYENVGNNAYEYFERDEFDGELGFLEGQDSNSDDDEEMDEDDGIDVDEMTYEELIALGEFIGEEKRGLSLNEISKCLRPCEGPPVRGKSGIDKCVICQLEYEEGEGVAGLIPCGHPYHTECITSWLQVKKICPICSTEVSPPKIDGSKDKLG